MPSVDMRIEDYETMSYDTHRWIVLVPPLFVDAVSTRYAIYFGSRVGRFDCSCSQIKTDAQPICDHKLFVARYITSKAGRWERDRVLMEYAWDMVRKPKFEILSKDSPGYYDEWWVIEDRGNKEEFRAKVTQRSDDSYMCTCLTYNLSGMCEHIDAVLDAERDQDRLTGKRVTVKPEYPILLTEELKKRLEDQVRQIYESRSKWNAVYKDEPIDVTTLSSGSREFVPSVDPGKGPDETGYKVVIKNESGKDIEITDFVVTWGPALNDAIENIEELNQELQNAKKEQEPPDEPPRHLRRFEDLDL